MKKYILLLIFPLLFLLIDINVPFVGPFGNNNATYSLQAKNYIRHGYIKNKFAPLTNPGATYPQSPKFYVNHPPLLQILLSVSYKIFGQNFHWAGRVVPLIATLFSILLISKIAEVFYGKKEALLVFLYSASLPMLIVYGKLIQFEPLVLLWSLSSLLLFRNYLQHKNVRTLFFLLITLFLGLLSDLPMLLFIILLGGVSLWHSGLKDRLLTLLLFGLGIVFLILYFIYAGFILNDADGLLYAYLNRSFNASTFTSFFSIASLFVTLILRMVIYFTPLGLLFLVINIYLTSLTKHISLDTKLALVLLSFPVLNVLLFPNGAWEHPYWLFYFLPIVLLSLSCVTIYLLDFFRHTWPQYIMIGIVLLNIIFGIFIFQLKRIQTNKAIWQDTFIEKVIPITPDTHTIVMNWDFNDDLTRYKTDKNVLILWDRNTLLSGIEQNKNDWKYFIFACWANCSANDKLIELSLRQKYRVAYEDSLGNAILLDLLKDGSFESPNRYEKPAEALLSPTDSSFTNRLISIYRKVKSFFGLEQI